MAWASQGFYLSVTQADKNGDESNKEYQLTAADYATAVTDTATILAALGAMTDSALSKYQVEARAFEDTLVLPSSMAPISTKMSVTTTLDGAGSKKANYEFAMPKAAILSGKNLIITNAAVLAYHALYQTGGEAKLSDGEVADALLRGRVVTRGRRFGA
jgi:hypothetical protein